MLVALIAAISVASRHGWTLSLWCVVRAMQIFESGSCIFSLRCLSLHYNARNRYTLHINLRAMFVVMDGA